MDFWKLLLNIGALTSTGGLAVLSFCELYYNFKSRQLLYSLQEVGILKSEREMISKELQKIDSNKRKGLIFAFIIFCVGFLAHFISIIGSYS